MKTKHTNLKLLLLSIASFLYLLILSVAYTSPDPCAATQDFKYPIGRVLSTIGPFLLIGVFYFLFKKRFIAATTKRKLLLSFVTVSAVILAALVFTAAVYVFVFPALEKNTSGVLYRLVCHHDCYNDASPSDLLTNISFVIGQFISFKIALGIADKVSRKKLRHAL